MLLLPLPLPLLLLFSCHAFANVEKTIFRGPPVISIPTVHPNLDDLALIPLSPLHLSVRTRLNASFPSDESPNGAEHWFLLDGLSPSARYEARICWLATVPSIRLHIPAHTPLTNVQQQPTEFSLSTHTLEEVFDNPDLLTALSAYAYARQAEIDHYERQRLAGRRAVHALTPNNPAEQRISILFLRIFAAADYYTLDKVLMENVPPVLVDVILDPYMWNLFPTSLLPTAGYVLVVALVSWFLSKYVWKLVLALATPAPADAGQQSEQASKKNS